MPKVKLLTSRSEMVGKKTITQKYGDEIEVSENEAKALIATNQAVPVKQRRPRQAVRKPTETRADAMDAKDSPDE